MSTIKILLIFCIYFLTTTLLSAQITKIEENKLQKKCKSDQLYYKAFAVTDFQAFQEEKLLIYVIDKLCSTISTSIVASETKNNGSQSLSRTNYKFSDKINYVGDKILVTDSNGKTIEKFFTFVLANSNEKAIIKYSEKKDTDKTWYSNEIELPNNINWYTNTFKELEINGCEFEFVEGTETSSICVSINKKLITNK